MGQRYGHQFGNNVRFYDQARRTFPLSIIHHLQKVSVLRTKAVDIGCGTGIATRQLHDFGFIVVGTDCDERMIQAARDGNGGRKIEYLVAPAHDMPFLDASVEIITAFSAFHWFCNQQTLREACRVLTEDGLIFIVNKYDKSEVMAEVKHLLGKFAGTDLLRKDPKSSYNPSDALTSLGFRGLDRIAIDDTERFTIEHFLNYVRSTSYWSRVSKREQAAALTQLKSMLEEYTSGGQITRPLRYEVVTGLRPIGVKLDSEAA